MSRLKEKYEKEILPVLLKEFRLKNRMAAPRMKKIVVNAGIGLVARNKELMEAVGKDIAAITGQKPSIRPAKVSEAGFNVRAGMPVGLKVTLRGKRMYDFLDRLVSIVLPRLRDFRGLPLKSFDKSGNYSLGISEHTVFPEVDMGKAGKPHGLEITIVTNSNETDKSKRLLELLGVPFQKEQKE